MDLLNPLYCNAQIVPLPLGASAQESIDECFCSYSSILGSSKYTNFTIQAVGGPKAVRFSIAYHLLSDTLRLSCDQPSDLSCYHCQQLSPHRSKHGHGSWRRDLHSLIKSHNVPELDCGHTCLPCNVRDNISCSSV